MGKSRKIKKIILVSVSLVILVVLLSSCDRAKMRNCYSDPDNFITVSGKVVDIHYDGEHSNLYLKIDNLPSGFSDDYFKIVGNNVAIVQNAGIENKVFEGTEIEFATSSWYLGNGYIMPIVAITVDGEELLSFEEGYENLLEWLG